jgi:subtilisin family serine protease
MTHRAAGGRRLQMEPLEERFALSAQSAASAHGAGTFQATYAPLLQQADPALRAALEAITTTAPADQLVFDIGPVTSSSGGDVGASLAESTTLIGLKDFQDDVRFAGIDGSDFAVVVLDTGVDLDHPFFGPDSDDNGVADRIVYHADFVGDGSTGQDVNGHGTHVSSIAVSSDPVYGGIAPGAKLIHLRVLNNSGFGSAAAIEAALQWVVANAAAYNVVSVNMSISAGNNFNAPNTRPDMGISDELAALGAQGVIVASAAGNSYADFQGVPGVTYPAADPNSLAVSASWDANAGGPFAWSGGSIDFTTGPDRLVSFSQRHTTMTSIVAPGAAIAAAAIGGGVTVLGGTSMAAPHIAGLAAIVQQLAVDSTGQRLTPTQFKDLLRTTGMPIFDGDDENDNVPNTNEWYRRVDVMALGNAILSGGLSDLAFVGEPTLATESVPTGGTVRANYAIANQGSASSGTFAAGFFLSTDATLDELDVPLATANESLAGGAMISITGVGVQLPDGLAPGTYHLAVVLDSAAAVTEGNEGNNVAFVEFTVTAPQPEIWLVDESGALLLDGLSAVDFGTVDQGAANVSKTFRIFNDGSATLNLGALIVPAGYTTPGFPIGQTSIPAGEFVEFTISLNSTGSLGTKTGAASFTSNDSDESPFTISLTGKIVEPDDHGNDAETATPVTMPATVSGTIFSSGESDWFRVQAVAGVEHRFETILGTLGDSLLRVYDTDGATLLAVDDDNGPGLASLVNWTAPHDGTFYLQVSRKGTTFGTYQLAMALADDHAANAGGATLISDPSQTPSAIESAGDDDWFRFAALAGVEYEIEAMLDSLSSSTIRLFDVDGNTQIVVNSVDANVGSLIRWTAPKDGVYFIAVEAAATELIGTYTLKLTGDDDHGDDPFNATPIAAPGSALGVIETPFDPDWFAVEVVAGARYEFATVLGTLVDSVIRVVAADTQTELAHSDDFNGTLASHVEWTAPASGMVYIEVRGLDWRTGSYELTTEIIDDQGDDAATATATTDPSVQVGVIALAGDVDAFKFAAFAGVAYRFAVTPGELPAARLLLRGIDGVAVLADAEGAGGEPVVIEWVAPASGNYSLEVSSAVEGGVGGYSLSIAGDDDHGDNAANTTPLEIPHAVDGRIERAGDVDWFAVDTLPGLNYGIDVGLGTLPNVRVRVYEADGTTLVTQAVSSSDVFAAARWRAEGERYYVEIVAAGVGAAAATPSNGIGDYRVTPALLSALPGDYDGDVDVDGNDFLVWQRRLGQSALNAATLLTSGGFEGFQLDVDLGAQLPWRKLERALINNATPGSAVVQDEVASEGDQAVRVNRGRGMDSWWGVPLAEGLPASDFVLVTWEMMVVATGLENGALGPFFGVEANDDDGEANAVGVLGAFGVDATTLDLIYQAQDTGVYTETGLKAAAGVWHEFAMAFDFVRNEYTAYFNGQPVATTGFVDRGALHTQLDGFTDAVIAARATQTNQVSRRAEGTAYFDDFRILDGASGRHLPADGNGDDVIDGRDLQVSRDHYGLDFSGRNPQSELAAATSAPIPHAAASVTSAGALLASVPTLAIVNGMATDAAATTLDAGWLAQPADAAASAVAEVQSEEHRTTDRSRLAPEEGRPLDAGGIVEDLADWSTPSWRSAWGADDSDDDDDDEADSEPEAWCAELDAAFSEL